MRNTACKLTILVLLMSAFCPWLKADAGHYLITTEDGLSNSSVNCIFQDTGGMMWFGTWDGLNVYDGHRLRVFRYNIKDESSLLDNIVRDVVQEDEYHFWIISAWGVSRLDIRTGKFSRFRLGMASMNSFAGGGVSLAIADDGTVFCSSRGWGIAYYDELTDRMIPFNVLGYATSGISGITAGGGDTLLVMNEAGSVSRLSFTHDGRTRSIEASISENLLSSDSGVYLMAHSRNDGKIFFIGTRRIYEYDCGLCSVVDSIEFTGTVSYAAMSPDHYLNIVADRSSLYRVDFRSHEVFRIDALCRDNLLSFYYGTQGIVWLGVDGVGVEAYCTDLDPMKTLRSDVMFEECGGAVTSIVQAQDGDIYTSVLGGGLFVLDPKGNPKRPVASEFSEQDRFIFSMVAGPGNTILLGVRNAVKLYSPATGTISTLYKFRQKPPVLAYCMYYDDLNQRLWVGTLDNGIVCLSLDVDGHCQVVSVRRYLHDRNDDNSLNGDSIMHLSPADGGEIWVGTLGGGLSLLDVETERFRRIDVGAGYENIPSNNVRFVTQDDSLSVWVGTSYGLSHGVKQKDGWSFTLYDEGCGLTDNTIQAIIKDDKERVWLSTNRGISMLDLRTGKFLNYTNPGSLQGKEFYINSCLMSASGEIFFGGVNGLNHFLPDDLRPRSFSPRIVVEHVAISRDNVKPVMAGRRVVLRHDENFFNIAFSALEFIGNADCEYSYILRGFNETWVTVSSGTPAMFTNVPPGKYTFMVRSTNGDKVWCDNTEQLEIYIRSPWYKTIWAMLAYLSLIALFTFAGIRFYRERRSQKRQLADEAAEKQAQKEAYEAKLTFFTNIAHEFSTPLTLISCSGERLESVKQQDLTKGKRYVKIINDNAARMQRLIQELLEFRKVENGCYDFVFAEVDVCRMVNSILGDFTEVGEERGVRLNLNVENLPDKFFCDASAMEKVFMNLISNAYKYTPDNGTIDISLDGRGDGINAVISNTSKGLSDEKLRRVFDRFVILDNFERQMAKGRIVRNGVGMALVKSLVTALGGEINVSSVVGESVTFVFFIPSAPEDKVARVDGSLSYEGVSLPSMVAPAVEGRNEPTVEDDLVIRNDGKPVVMIVDDDPQIREMVSDILADEYSMVKAQDGEAALAILGIKKVDLVITDINMPVMGGNELLRRMKENELMRFIPVVILAMKTDVSDEIVSYNLGSDAFIPKPFLPAQLTAVVSGILRKRSGLKDYYSSSASDQEMFYGVEMSSKDRQFMVSIVNLIEDNITEDLSPEEIASRLCVSEMTLYRRMKGIIGKSPGEFIRTVRLKHAAKLLKTTTLNIQEVMFDSGFNNKSWFYRKFAEMYGMSPKEYRESL